MHDYRSQREDTFETFRQAGRGVKLPKEAVVVYEFVAEMVDTPWPKVHAALRAKGFKTHQDGDVLEVRVGPIAVDAETIWTWEELATQIVLPFEFYPDGWELDD